MPHVFFIFTWWRRRIGIGVRGVTEKISGRGSYVIRSDTVRVGVLRSIFWSVIYNNPEIN